ncbi:MAG TPA: hypothetical protein VHY37_02855 [Tepidisphaeraceae bacterium]|jgi:hypothetical protein|nr:hypothetical protein [Tepidisphaeraceae bacterium]
MGQINPFSAYGTDPVQLDRHLIDEREGNQPRRQPKRQKPKPQPQAEDHVELHTAADEAPAPPPAPDTTGDGGHLDITA